VALRGPASFCTATVALSELLSLSQCTQSNNLVYVGLNKNVLKSFPQGLPVSQWYSKVSKQEAQLFALGQHSLSLVIPLWLGTMSTGGGLGHR